MRILTLCFNATDVTLWSGDVQTLPAVKNALLQLPLQRLSGDLSHLQRSDFLAPSIQSITHLDVVTMGSKRREWKDWEILTSLPKLTHLCINKNVEVDAINNLLSQCASLSLLVAVINTESHRPTKPSGSYHTIDDHRLVLIDKYDIEKMVTDWEDGANGRPDMWDFCGLIRDARDGKPFIFFMTIYNPYLIRIGAYLKDNSQRWLSRVFFWENELNNEGMEWYKDILFTRGGDILIKT